MDKLEKQILFLVGAVFMAGLFIMLGAASGNPVRLTADEATGAALALGDGTSTANAFMLHDVGSAESAYVGQKWGVAGATTLSWQINNPKDGSSNQSRSWQLQCNNGMTGTPTWLSIIDISGGAAVGNDCELVLANGMAVSGTFAYSGASDVTFAEGLAVNKSLWVGNIDKSGPRRFAVSGNTSGNDCGTCGASEVSDLCHDTDGDGSTNCVGGECVAFICDGVDTWDPIH